MMRILIQKVKINEISEILIQKVKINEISEILKSINLEAEDAN